MSYDSQEILSRFAKTYSITYPLLSDKGSEVIRKFGIFNTNVPEGVRLYGVPFPGEYLIAQDGTVREKIFLPNYQTRSTGSELLMHKFGSSTTQNGVVISAEDVRAKIVLSNNRSFPGQELGVTADFDVTNGWHIYGRPLPEGYVPTSIEFDKNLVASQKMDFPKPTPVKFAALNETLSVYQGKFKATGEVLLKRLDPGEYKLGGTLRFQECNDEMCKMPQTVNFEIPLTIEAMPAPPSK